MQQFCRSNYTGGHFMGNGFPGIKQAPRAGPFLPAGSLFIKPQIRKTSYASY
jgi:hypothetical protein